jgi:hypothetical protein
VGISAEAEELIGGGIVAVVDDDFPGWRFTLTFATDQTVTLFDVERATGSRELTRTALKALPFGSYEQAARRALYEMAEAWHRGVRLSPETERTEAEERYWATKFAEAGLRSPKWNVRTTARVSATRGRAPVRGRRRKAEKRTELWFATLAKRYVDLLRDGMSVYGELRVDFGLGEQSVRNAIRQARKEGYLTPTIKGRKGGELTEKAIKILKQGEGDDGEHQEEA